MMTRPDIEQYHNIQMNNVEYPLKPDKMAIAKTIFALNNLPVKMHEILFSCYENVSHQYYQISFKRNNGIFEPLSINCDGLNEDMLNGNIRFIFIRINIIKSTNKVTMNHVNCVVIDKWKQYILYFEPMFVLRI